MKLVRLKKWDDFGLEILLELLSWKRFNVCTFTYSGSDLYKPKGFWPEFCLSISMFRWHAAVVVDIIYSNHSLEISLFQKTCNDYASSIPPLMEF
jgi:hypothetical protein